MSVKIDPINRRRAWRNCASLSVFYFKHCVQDAVFSTSVVCDVSQRSVSIHSGLWLDKYLRCIDFLWMGGRDCCGGLCLVHTSTGPALNTVSPKPLFMKHRQAACSRWDITAGCRNLQNRSRCSPRPVVICESEVTSTCRTQERKKKQKNLTTAEMHPQIRNVNLGEQQGHATLCEREVFFWEIRLILQWVRSVKDGAKTESGGRAGQESKQSWWKSRRPLLLASCQLMRGKLAQKFYV